jgi:hypothetical protein
LPASPQYGIFNLIHSNTRNSGNWKVTLNIFQSRQNFEVKEYSLTGDIDRYLNLKSKATDIWVLSEEGGCEVPDYYYKGRLMMQYLIDIRHLSYDQVLKDTTSENTIYQEMIKWKDNKL